MKRLMCLLLLPAVLLQWSCRPKSNEPDDTIPVPTNAWTLMDGSYFGSSIYHFQLFANNNKVYAGYWDGDLNKPCVRKFNPTTKTWDYQGGGPITIPSNAELHWSEVTFMFRQDGNYSYVGFMRSLTERECLLYRSNGGAWEQLPSVPKNLLPGYNAGYGDVHQDGYELTAQNGKVYALLHYDNDTWQSEQTVLAVFVFENNNWSLLPLGVSYPQIPNSFRWEANFLEPTITVSKNGNIYLNYWLAEGDPDRLSANVSVYNGNNWSRITTSNLHQAGSASSVTYKFNLDVYEEGSTDHLVMTPTLTASTNYSRVLTYNGSSWKEITSPSPDQYQMLSTAIGTCATCIYAKFSDVRGFVVKKYTNGGWDYVGKAGFSSGGSGGIGYNQDFVYDGGYLYLASAKDHKSGSVITPRTLCVYQYKLP